MQNHRSNSVLCVLLQKQKKTSNLLAKTPFLCRFTCFRKCKRYNRYTCIDRNAVLVSEFV